MLTLTTASILEKNKVATDGVWLMLLDITYQDETMRLVNNTENIEFNGSEYLAFPFNVSDVTEDSKELPQVTLQVSNATGAMEQLVDYYGGLVDSSITLRVINTNVPNVAEMEEFFIITGTSVNSEWVVFQLGSDYAVNRRYPATRIMKDFCPFKYKGIRCGYQGSMGECNKTLADCRKRNNSERFGGAPSIPVGGMYE